MRLFFAFRTVAVTNIYRQIYIPSSNAKSKKYRIYQYIKFYAPNNKTNVYMTSKIYSKNNAFKCKKLL